MIRLLFDQNLSRHLVRQLKDVYPNSDHVLFLGFQQSGDEIIWNYAIEKEFTIVTQDSDFLEKSILHSHPPKVIILRCGNSSTRQIISILKSNQKKILAFINDDNLSYLELF